MVITNIYFLIISSIIIGILATLFMDIWAYFQKLIIQSPGLNYALVGRWLIYMINDKKIFHNTIITSSPKKNETIIGWIAHYVIGMIFAFIFLLTIAGKWSLINIFVSSIIFGIITSIFPFFIMQPAFGFGIFASKTPSPNINRIKSFITHLSFGLGLFLSSSLMFFYLQDKY